MMCADFGVSVARWSPPQCYGSGPHSRVHCVLGVSLLYFVYCTGSIDSWKTLVTEMMPVVNIAANAPARHHAYTELCIAQYMGAAVVLR